MSGPSCVRHKTNACLYHMAWFTFIIYKTGLKPLGSCTGKGICFSWRILIFGIWFCSDSEWKPKISLMKGKARVPGWLRICNGSLPHWKPECPSQQESSAWRSATPGNLETWTPQQHICWAVKEFGWWVCKKPYKFWKLPCREGSLESCPISRGT